MILTTDQISVEFDLSELKWKTHIECIFSESCERQAACDGSNRREDVPSLVASIRKIFEELTGKVTRRKKKEKGLDQIR